MRMTGFKGLINELGYTYLDRFYEKLAYKLSKSIDSDVSAINTLTTLADEMCFTDDGYLYYIIESTFNLEEAEDIRFRIEYIKNSSSYVLLINDKLYSAFDALTSTLKSSIEDYFYE